MAVYPIKLLKDESGQPFVPLTSVEAIYGDKNLQYILNVTQVSNGHFKVKCNGLTLKDATNSVIAVRWPEITTVVKPSYLQLNDEAEKAIYAPDGTNYLDLEDSTDAVNFVAYDGSKWVLIGNVSTGSGGHVITDGEGNTMEQQKILNFVGFNVENDNANRATKVINPTPINNLNTTTSGQGPLDAYQGHVLNDKFENYLPLSGGTVAGEINLGKTSYNFNKGAIPGVKLSSAATLPELLTEVRYSNGQMGSVNFSSDYNSTITRGWWLYLYIPHRIGGINGTKNGDNTDWGVLILMGMTVQLGKMYTVNFQNGAIGTIAEH